MTEFDISSTKRSRTGHKREPLFQRKIKDLESLGRSWSCPIPAHGDPAVPWCGKQGKNIPFGIFLEGKIPPRLAAGPHSWGNSGDGATIPNSRRIPQGICTWEQQDGGNLGASGNKSQRIWSIWEWIWDDPRSHPAGGRGFFGIDIQSPNPGWETSECQSHAPIPIQGFFPLGGENSGAGAGWNS